MNEGSLALFIKKKQRKGEGWREKYVITNECSVLEDDFLMEREI